MYTNYPQSLRVTFMGQGVPQSVTCKCPILLYFLFVSDNKRHPRKKLHADCKRSVTVSSPLGCLSTCNHYMARRLLRPSLPVKGRCGAFGHLQETFTGPLHSPVTRLHARGKRVLTPKERA